MSLTRRWRWTGGAGVLGVLLGSASPGSAGPINTDAALTPREGGNILRLQYSYSETDARSNIEHINTSNVRATYVHGLRQDLAIFLSVPYVNRQVDRVLPRLGRVEDAHDGIGDITVLAKYRFWQEHRGPSETSRWAVLGGLDIRSGDSAFSSDSYDPILGTVFSWRKDRMRFDADLIYQFNTGGGSFRHDTLRYDLAYSHRLFPEAYPQEQSWEFDAVAELNGRYGTDRTHEVFLSPGFQFITERWIFETSIQLPVIQSIDGPETDYRLVFGFRFQW